MLVIQAKVVLVANVLLENNIIQKHWRYKVMKNFPILIDITTSIRSNNDSCYSGTGNNNSCTGGTKSNNACKSGSKN